MSGGGGAFRLASAAARPEAGASAKSTSSPKSGSPWLDRLTGLFCCCANLCRGTAPRTSQFRTVIPNPTIEELPKGRDHPNKRYLKNEIKTTKYSVLTFFPKNLFEQFHRFANLYFIFVVILNWIPEIEAFGRELSLMPVIFVISVTAIKDAFEDFRRYKSDQKINASTCRVWLQSEKRYAKTEWKSVMVGDWIHLSCNEKIPADILLLKSSDPNGICYVETSNLDGESNLKQRQVLNSQNSELQKEDPSHFHSTIECEAPNSAIYKFNAFLLHSDGKRESANKDNLLLRGCDLRNTDFVEGIVIYAGHETKSLMNNTGPRYKRSDLERLMNWDIVWCFVMLLVMCAVGAIGSGLWLNSFSDPYAVQYLTFSPNVPLKPALEAFKNFWSYIIVLQIMIPISLYVSVELIKLGQIFFILRDAELYDEVSDRRIQCRALNITEELGQIQYVLSDKTGTLTENKMIFRRCAVAGVDYGPPEMPGDASEGKAAREETVEDVQCNLRLLQTLKALPTALNLGGAGPMLSPESPSGDAMTQEESGEHRVGGGKAANDRDLYDFFVNMTICNTVVVAAKEHHDAMNASGVFVAEDFAADRASLASGVSRATTPVNELSVPGLGTPLGRPATRNGKGLRVPRLAPVGEHSGPTPVDLKSPKFFQGPIPVPDGDGVEVPPLDLDGDDLTQDDGATGLSMNDDTTAGLSNDDRLSARIPEIRTEAASGDDGTPVPPPSGKPGQSPRPSLFSGLTKGGSFLSLPGWRKRKGDASGASTPAPPPNPVYEAESPDELSLVFAARAYGFRLIKRQMGLSYIELPDGNRERYQVLHTLPFDSVRKRMSVIVRSPHSTNPIIFSKGADNAMMELLCPTFSESARGQHLINKTMEYVNVYASYGLRTLCLCRREIPLEEYQRWSEAHLEAEVAIHEREELLFESAKRVEANFYLLGVTGIEDRLQDGVSSCIAALRHAGIKVWVLTGDKIETAVNIAYACRLFTYGMNLLQLCAKTEADTRELIELNLDRLKARQDGFPEGSGRREKIGLVIDGRTLAFCLRNRKAGAAGVASLPRDASLRTIQEAETRKETEEKFVELLSRCSSVLCCRATPSQKAHIVRLVKKHMEGKTLAIGDGANDVAMIQSADVGVGISGQEGMQAVMASDFAIARFRFLRRLLLVHGHWCYDRLARTVLYFFYKNALFVFSLFWFQLFCGFSSQVIIDPIYLMIYNLIFTSVPPLLLGILDQDASDQLLMDQPRLYSVGRTGSLYKSYSFWFYMLDALWQSLVIYFVPHLIYSDAEIGLWSFGFLIFSAIVICNQLHLAIDVKSWTWPLLVSIIGSILVYYTFALVYNAIVQAWVENPPYWVAERMMSDPTYWFALVFICILAMLPKMTVKILGNSLAPPVVLLARLRLKAKQGSSSSSQPSWLARFTAANPSVTIVASPDGAESARGHGSPTTLLA